MNKNFFSIKTIIKTLTVFTILIIGISTYTGWKLVHPLKAVLSIQPVDLPHKNVTFTDVNNSITLKGWLFSSSSRQTTVIMAHGYNKNRLQFGEKTFDLVKEIYSKGYNVLLFDFRNSGESDTAVTSVGLYEKNDLLGAIKFMKTQGTKKIVLLGFSMGASTSIMAAVESKDIVSGVISDSAFAELRSYLDENLSVWSHLPQIPFTWLTIKTTSIMLGMDISQVSPLNSMSQLQDRPVLLIHGTQDKKIPSKNSELLFKAGSSMTEFWEVPNANHVDAFNKYHDEYINKIITFLDKCK